MTGTQDDSTSPQPPTAAFTEGAKQAGPPAYPNRAPAAGVDRFGGIGAAKVSHRGSRMEAPGVDTVVQRCAPTVLDKEFPSDITKKQVSYVHLRPAHDVGIHQKNMTAWRHFLPRC